MADLPKLVLCAICGIIFGIAMEKGRVFEPASIRLQMSMEKFIMMKMFLSAVTSGIVSIAILSVVKKRDFQAAEANFHGPMSAAGEVSALLGGAMLGAGMTLAGACPGMVMVQVGTGVPEALYTVLGGLAGALAYGVTEPILRRFFDHRTGSSSSGAMRGHGSSYISLALPIAAAFGSAVFALELMSSWRSEIRFTASYPSQLLESAAWPPYVAGAIIGCLQAPVILIVHDSLGSSGAYRTAASQLLLTRGLQREFSYLNSFRTGLANWYQVAYLGGAVGGAYLSASWSHTLYSTPGVPMQEAFVGGFLMLYGASFASGCTSGHGLSGLAFMNFKSLLAVAAMFAGGMATKHYYPGL